jgi:sugar phosphate isomerase/epimerase
MKIGVCMKAEEALARFPVTADYVDVFAYPLVDLDGETRRALARATKDGSLPVYSLVRLFPKNIHLTGEAYDLAAIRDFSDRALNAQAELGIKTVVFGSGNSRRIPDGFSHDRAWAQLDEAGAVLADLAKGYGQKIAVEFLSPAEDNTFNSLSTTVRYIERLGRDNMGVTLDFYHFNNSGEELSLIEKYKDLILHAHIASPTRKACQSDEDWAFFRERVALLHKIGYTGNLTYEGAYESLDELSDIIADMKAHL